jgi:hypothetical protein
VSVFAAGMASMPVRGRTSSSRTSGAIFDGTPITDKWRGEMQAVKDKLRASYGGPGPYTVAHVLADVDHWWGIATKFANEAPSLNMKTPALVKQARDNALNLLEARAQLKLRKPAEIVDAKEGRVYLEAMVAPIDWLISTGAPVLTSREESMSTIKKIAYIGLGIGVIYGLSRLLSSGAELTREVRSFRPAPAGMVHNPPSWAADPEIWENARLAVEQSGPYENVEAVKIHVYKQLGGRVS